MSWFQILALLGGAMIGFYLVTEAVRFLICLLLKGIDE